MHSRHSRPSALTRLAVGRWRVLPILLHIHAVQAQVHAVDVLEQQDDLQGTRGESVE
jgi:hypothetical protein